MSEINETEPIAMVYDPSIEQINTMESSFEPDLKMKKKRFITKGDNSRNIDGLMKTEKTKRISFKKKIMRTLNNQVS